MRKLLLFLSCFFAVSSAAYGGNVDTFGIGSAETALGGAYSATADDPYAVYYNAIRQLGRFCRFLILQLVV
ncbi:hypothetical protein [Desulfurobacterium sp.]